MCARLQGWAFPELSPSTCHTQKQCPLKPYACNTAPNAAQQQIQLARCCAFLQGSLLHSGAWYNLSRQGLQPSLRVGEVSLPALRHLPPGEVGDWAQAMLRAAPTLEACYSGGSCVQTTGSPRGCRQVSLFCTAIPLPPGGLEAGYAASDSGSTGAAPVLALTLSSAPASLELGDAPVHAPTARTAAEAGAAEVALPGDADAPSLEKQSRPQQPAGATCVVLLLPEGPAGSRARQLLGLLEAATDGSYVRYVLPGKLGAATGEGSHTGTSLAAGPASSAAEGSESAQRQVQREDGQLAEQEEQQGQQQELSWVRRRYHVLPSDLPAAPFQPWELVSVDLLVVPGEGCNEAKLCLGKEGQAARRRVCFAGVAFGVSAGCIFI
jgi:hypothetical protein